MAWGRIMLGRVVLVGVLALVMGTAAWAGGPIPAVGASGTGADGFAQVLGPREFEFPRDDGPHPEYRQEWWYVTGNLDSTTGERFGFELTFFRFALAPRDVGGESAWRARQIYMAHFAITDAAHKQFRFAEKLSRGGAIGVAGARNPPLNVWIDDWSLGACLSHDRRSEGDPQRADQSYEDQGRSFPGRSPGYYGSETIAESRRCGSSAAGEHDSDRLPEDGWNLHAVEHGYELTLDAQVLPPPVLNGDRGFSRKSSDPGSASYYYSIPRVAVHGRLVRDGKPLEVKGLAWVDREWGSGALGRSEQGWDWFALQLGEGSAMMFYSLRDHDGRRDPHSGGTWIAPSGQSQPLASDQVQIDVLDYWRNPRGDRYPAHWRVRVPAHGADLDIRPILPDQELTGSTRYWEGAVDVSGTSVGRGYVELVGYAAQ